MSDPSPPVKRFRPIAFLLGALAWVVIAGAVAIAAVRAEEANEANAQSSAGEEFGLFIFRFKARYLVGVNEWTRNFGAGDQQIPSQAKSLEAGPVDLRLRYAILAGELNGPDEALEALDRLDLVVKKNDAQLTAEQANQVNILRKLYRDYHRLNLKAPSLTEKQREQLVRQLDWFGELALAPRGQPGFDDAAAALAGACAAVDIHEECPDQEARWHALKSAYRVAAVMLLASFGVVALAGFGFLGLAGLAILASFQLLRGGLRCGRSPAGVYAETFALWLVSFEIAGYALSKLEIVGPFRLAVSLSVEVLSLGALAWPIIRGVPWRQVREDLGLDFGRRPLAEPAIGVGCYIMGFPLMLVCLVVTAILTVVLEPGHPSPDDLSLPFSPSHPVVLPLARGDWILRLQLFVLASIIAPLVEETMFRGVLYRHLRELIGFGPPWLGVIGSALFSSFIFAAIHPQGLVAIPVLMGLAVVFALTREWRGTLIPCMVAHGLSNGLVLLLNIGMLAD
jgi:membrane protease YdiL (CAAX protease family)